MRLSSSFLISSVAHLILLGLPLSAVTLLSTTRRVGDAIGIFPVAFLTAPAPKERGAGRLAGSKGLGAESKTKPRVVRTAPTQADSAATSRPNRFFSTSMDTILVSTAPEPWPRATDAIVAAALSASGNLRSDAESGAGSTNDGNSAVVANGGTADSAVPSVRVAYVDNPKPDYPAAARETGAQGTVLLRVLVDRKGLAAKIDLQRRSGFTDLDRAALEKVKLWRFRPARRGDRLIEDWVTIPIVFRLDDVVSKP